MPQSTVLQKVSAPNAWVPLLLCPKVQCSYGCAPNAVHLVPASPWQYVVQMVLDDVNQDNQGLMNSLMEVVSELLQHFTAFTVKIRHQCLPGLTTTTIFQVHLVLT